MAGGKGDILSQYLGGGGFGTGSPLYGPLNAPSAVSQTLGGFPSAPVTSGNLAPGVGAFTQQGGPVAVPPSATTPLPSSQRAGPEVLSVLGDPANISAFNPQTQRGGAAQFNPNVGSQAQSAVAPKPLPSYNFGGGAAQRRPPGQRQSRGAQAPVSNQRQSASNPRLQEVLGQERSPRRRSATADR